MDREPNAREKEIAKELFSILNHSKLPDADLFEKGMVESLASYRAELRPEPTVGDMGGGEIERLESAINEAYCREGDDGVPLVRDLLQAALAAARGNRAELEAAAREAVAEACEFCRYGKKELPGRRDYCKSEHCQWLKIINALAEKG